MTAAVEAGASAACVVLVGGPRGTGHRVLLVRREDGTEEHTGSLGDDGLDRRALEAARSALDDPRHRDGLVTPGDGAERDEAETARNVDAGDESAGEGAPVELYVEVRRPVPELVVVGAGHIARPLCTVAALLGFRVVVVDDRPAFATRERFPEAERLVQADFSDPFADVPLHGRSHLLLVTRGHKYDYQCLVRILKEETAPAYIGMIGSRRRVRATFHQLLEDGIPHARLGEIHAPVGLDVGAETPEEIAVAVAAELVLVRRGGSGRRLREVERVAERFFPDDGEDG
jgi:xanthine dehydrogenase accessory factor